MQYHPIFAHRSAETKQNPRGGTQTTEIGVRIDFFSVSTYFRPKKFKSGFKSILTPHLQHFPSIATTIATAKLAIFCTSTL